MVMTSATVAALTAPYLRHTCTIRRAGAATGFDPYNDPTPGATTDATGVPCWCYQPDAIGEEAGGGRELVAHRWRVLVPAGTAVAEADAVLNVRDDGGVTIVAGPLNIDEVLRHRGHLTLDCGAASRPEVTP